MSYSSSGSGRRSISGSNDVSLNNPGNSHVLAYNGTTAKWRNQMPVPGDFSGLDDVINTLIAAAMAGNTAWSSSNLPWVLRPGETLTDGWPSVAMDMIRPLSSSGSTFRDQLNNTLAAGPCIIQLPAGTYHLSGFYTAATGSTQSTSYGYGYLQPPNLRGLLGAGANQTFIVMDPNSMTSDQVDAISALDGTSGPVRFSMMTFAQGAYSSSGPTGNPLYIAGITFRGNDQPNATAGAASGTPTPYRGISIRGAGGGVLQFCRFQGCGRTATTAPPYETGGLEFQYDTYTVRRVESDGRLAPSIDANRTRRGGVLMMNNEFSLTIQDAWFHHSYLTRYAVNDGNRVTTGTYSHERVVLEQIGNVSDSGAPVSRIPIGYENVGGNVIWTDSTVRLDATVWNTAHLKFTTVTGQTNVNPPPGELDITDSAFTHGYTAMDGYFVLQLLNGNNWWTGDITTIPVVVKRGSTTLAPYQLTSAPTSASLSSAGVSTATHYLIFVT